MGLRTFSTGLLLTIAVISVFSVGCAGLPVTLRKMIDTGSFEKAASKGQKFLDKHQAEPKHRGECDVIIVLVAEANFNLATRTDTVAAYKEFRRRYLRVAGTSEMCGKALLLEATASFRDVAKPADTIRAYQLFQQQYPGGPEAIEAGTREAHLALLQAEAQSSVQALKDYLRSYSPRTEAAVSVAEGRKRLVAIEYDAVKKSKVLEKVRGFRLEYARWAEAESVIANIRVLEAKLAYGEAVASADIDRIQGFRRAYGDWPEAVSFEVDAYNVEAKIAFDKGFDAKNIDLMKETKALYTRGDWPTTFDTGIADLYLDPVRKAVKAQRAMIDSDVDVVFRALADLPVIRFRAEDLRPDVLKVAKASKSGPMAFLYFTLFVEEADAVKIRDMAVAEYWKEVSRDDRAEKWLRFVTWFPDNRLAVEAEKRYLWYQELARKDAFGMTATITRTLRLSNGDVEIYVDVRDRNNNRVSGLTKDGFKVFRGSREADMTGFWGMDEERPLDIVFSIDMSGSMETEREAVRQAVSQFASILEFRGREANLGLVSFSEQVIDKHAFTSEAAKFNGWMSNLTKTTGGSTGEDGVLALLDSSSMLRTHSGERVSIFLSDEQLQINAGGRQRLAVVSTNPCDIARSSVACHTTCRENEKRGVVSNNNDPWGTNSGGALVGPECDASCINKLGREAARLLSVCTSRNDLSRCVNDGAFNNIVGNMLRGCGDPVIFDGSPETTALIKELDRVQVRPFFLVTAQEGKPQSAYVAVASKLQGRVMPVPDDSRSSTPYIQVLMEIAEQLSRQYVIRYRPPKDAAPEAFTQVLMRPIHRWSKFGSVPDVDIKALVGVGNNIGCPDFVLFASDGLYVSGGCGNTWARQETELTSHILDAKVFGQNALLLMLDGSVWLYSIGDKSLVAVPVEMEKVLYLSWLGPDDFWVSGRNADRTVHFEHKTRGDLTGQKYVIPATGKPQKLPGIVSPVFLSMSPTNAGKACMLISNDKMMCTSDNFVTMQDVKVSGLPANCLNGNVSVMVIDAHERIFLLAGGDGAVYRSVHNGVSWVKVLDPRKGDRRLMKFGTSPELVCAVSSKDVVCSEDAGMQFFPLGLAYDQKAGAALAEIGGYPVLASDGELQRLYRVMNRELPSSAVYFATGATTPSDSMIPFLRDIANEMKRDSSASLRIEGHADARGSDEHNDILAHQRAQSVADVIESMGVPSERLMVLSYGEKRPLQSGVSARALTRNRRVELIMLKSAPNTWFDSPQGSRR